MRKNSTSTILRRLGIVLFIGGVAHVLARVLWHFQAFGINQPGLDPFVQTCTEMAPTEIYPSVWLDCRMTEIQPTSFLEYTSDVGYIIGTHVLGLIGALLIAGVLYWIFIDTTPVECRDPQCACSQHGAELYDEATQRWVIRDCFNPECTCKSHHHDRFVGGRWVVPFDIYKVHQRQDAPL